MKLLLFSFLLMVSFCLSTSFDASAHLSIDGHSFGDTIGESYNSDDHEDIVAVTYGIATNRNGERPLLNYKPPQLVEKLPDIIVPPTQGPLESIDEVPSITTYYDGSLHLNVAEINCRIFTVPGSCVKQSQCGWCGETKSCIKGTALAPTEPCQGNSYLFGNFNNLMSPLIGNKGTGSK